MSQISTVDFAPENLMVSILRDERYGHLSTSWQDDNISTTFAYALGELEKGTKYALYWLSSPKSEHSQHIKQNSISSVSITDHNAPQGTGFGFRLRGHSEQLPDFGEQTKKAFNALKSKLEHFPETWDQINAKDSLRKIYMLAIDRVQINAAIEYKDKAGWKDYSAESYGVKILQRAYNGF